jgi:hypothetical protein
MATKKTVFSSLQSDKRAKRENHFATGGTCANWLGRSATFKDAKKEKSQKACRGKGRRGDE